jgi:hypothetical protein
MALSLLLVGGCERDHRRDARMDALRAHRWQIVQQPDAAAVWRLDVVTGALSYCNADFTNRLVLCMPQAVASTEPATAPTAAGTQPSTAAPIYPGQPRTAAPYR